jgi:hypothetical protein
VKALAISCLLLVSGLLQWGWAAPDTAPTGLSASLDKDSAPVGDTVVLTLDYRLPEGATLSKPLEVKGLDGLAVMGHEVVNGRIRIRLLVDRLQSWRSGPLVLSYAGADGQPGTLSADPVSLTVGSGIGEDPSRAMLRPIQDIFPARSRWLQALPWILGALAAVALAGAGFLWMRRRRVPTVMAKVMDPPHVAARKALELLVAGGLFEQGQVKAFYFGLSAILRQYLESLRGFPAAEYTTEEIARTLRQDSDRRLLPLLRSADLVKFSDSVPSPARKEEDVREALAFIEESAPAGEPAAGRADSGAGP